MKLGELIIKVGVDGVDRVKTGLRTMGDGLNDVAAKAKKTGEAITHGITMPFEEAISVVSHATGVMTVVSAVVGGVMTGAAVQASLSYSNLTARLEAITGSADTAARKLKFVQDVAGPSNFTFSQLADATTTLEAFGINAERALPTVARLGMAFGAGNDQLQMLVRGLGDIASGSFLEKDVAASFGLNRSMFEQQGIKFDGSGQLLSSATETMGALEKIVNERYGGIFDKIGNTPGAKLASLQDTWEKFSRVVGDSILQRAAPAIEYFSNLLNGMVSSNVLSDFLDRTGAAVDQLWQKLTGGVDFGDGLDRFLAGAMSVIENLPDAIGKGIDYLDALWASVKNNVTAVGGYIFGIVGGIAHNIGVVFKGMYNQAEPFLAALGHGVEKLGIFLKDTFLSFARVGWSLMQDLAGMIFNQFKIFGTLAKQAFPDMKINTSKMDLTSIVKDLQGAMGIDKSQFVALPKWEDTQKQIKDLPALPQLNLLSSMDDYYRRMKDGAAASAGQGMGVPNASGDFFTRVMGGIADQKGKDKTAEQTLERIEQNTRDAADALSLRTQAKGGGPLGQIGVTPAEMLGGAGVASSRTRGFARDSSATGLGLAIMDAVRIKAARQTAAATGGGFKPR